MPALRYVGPVPVASNSVITRQATDSNLTGMATAADLQSKVDTAVAPYALKTYVDQQDGLLATKAVVDAADALRVPTSWKGAANGVCDLSGTSIPAARIPKGLTFQVPMVRTYTSADFYSTVTTGTEDVFYPTSISLPSLSGTGNYYRFLVFGTFEAWSPSSSGKPYFACYINNVLVGYAGGRNGGSSGTSPASARSCPMSMVPVGNAVAMTPASTSGRTSASSVSIRVDFGNAFTGGSTVEWNPVNTQTVMTVFAVPVDS